MLSETVRKLLQGQFESHARRVGLSQLPRSALQPMHVSRRFRKAARAAGLRDFHFHDLRHHRATMALNAGFKGEIVMALGGWKSGKMMRRYAAVTD